MGHCCQKFIFGAVGCVGTLFRPPQCVLHLFSLGDVTSSDAKLGHTPLRFVPYRATVLLYPAHLPTLGDDAKFAHIGLSGHESLSPRAGDREIVWMNEHLPGVTGMGAFL